MEIPDQYLLGQSAVEQTRLQQQASAFANDSNWLFDQIRVAAGSRVVSDILRNATHNRSVAGRGKSFGLKTAL
ncbi:MAG: hypothetical protein ACLQBA_15245 [Candidatus Binataceae bacterium]